MATLTLNDARDIAARKRPWTLRMECVDPSINTNKYWFATGRGANEPVETGSGRIGSKPTLRLVDFVKFADKVGEKLGKGYAYVNTQYVRMSTANLAKLGVHRIPAVPSGTKAPHPSVSRAAGPGKPMPPPTGTPKPGLPVLSGPYALIVAVRPIKDGFKGLDKNGGVVLELTLAEGQKLIQDYGTPLIFSR